MVKIVEKVLIVLIIVITSFSTMILINFDSMNSDYYDNENLTEFPINVSQDTLGLNISFIKPSINNSIIAKKTYEIIVNITDDYPPTLGNVTIRISNSTTVLFSAPMNYSGNNLWSFNWDNISDYKSYIICIIHVWVMDSLFNEYWSEPWYVIIDLSEGSGPELILIIFYIIIISLIFALVIGFFNKRVFYKTVRKEQ